MTGPVPPKGTKPRVVVVGGGASGAMISVRLAEAGYEVIVFEKKEKGNGASSRSAACIRAQWETPETVLGMMYSEWFYKNFDELLKVHPDDRSWMIRQNGYLWLYEDPDHYSDPATHAQVLGRWEQVLEDVKMQQKLGLPAEILEADDVAKRWPHINPGRIIGAAWCQEDGFLNHDLIYINGFKRALELGVQLFEHTEVLAAETAHGTIIGVYTNKGFVETDWVVNATNIWGPQLSRRLGGMDLPVAAVKRYLYEFVPTNGIPASVGKLEGLPMTIYGLGGGRGAYSRPSGGSLMLGWAHDVPPDKHFTDEDQDLIKPGYRATDRGTPSFARALHDQIAAFAPELAACGKIESGTSGYYDDSPDHNPIIGQDALLSNLVHAVGFSGHGLMHAPITAVLVDAIISDRVEGGRVRLPEPFQESALSLDVYRPDRDFSKKKEGRVI
jgi:sarcosine oxidase subunit beta